MTGDRVKEQYYRNWIYLRDDGMWFFMDRSFEDHGPFDNFQAACKGVDDYLRRSVDDNNKEDAVGKEG